jgi:hypothetical protein
MLEKLMVSGVEMITHSVGKFRITRNVVLSFRTSAWPLFITAFNTSKSEDYFDVMSRLEFRRIRVTGVLYMCLNPTGYRRPQMGDNSVISTRI